MKKFSEFYENLSGEKLSDQEVLEAKQNFVGFFDLIYRIDRRNGERKKVKIIEDDLIK
jgi:hypothetical protein